MTGFVSRALRRLAARFPSSSRSQQATFTAIMQRNEWGDAESVSGTGSTQARGADFQREFVALLERTEVRSIIDAPCGDFNWMRNVLAGRDLHYTGIDIVEALIAQNLRGHAAPDRRFACADMTRADLPQADLILCRDGLVHLSFADAKAAIRNFRRSRSRYLLTTTFVERSRNTDVATGGWRVLNLQVAPFNLPAPLETIDERCRHTGGIYRDKRLGLWDLRALDD